MRSSSLTGSIVALITPMHRGGEIDYDSLNRLIEFHISNNTSAIVSVGTTGESATLSKSEHLAILKHTISFSNGRIPIIAGTGSNSTAEAIELSAEAQYLGANAVLLVTPYYNRPTQEGLYQHYYAISKAVSVDQILYNVPSRTSVDLEVETVVRLSQINHIIGLKDATGDLSVAKRLIEQCPDDFLLYSGDDATAVDFISLGGHGGVSVTANVVPGRLSRIYQLALLGQITKAKLLNKEITCLHKDLFIESNPIPVKWVLHEMGLCCSDIRLPLTLLSEQYKIIIKQDLEKVL